MYSAPVKIFPPLSWLPCFLVALLFFKTIPEKPNKRRPMLAALGTPSKTEPTDQEMLKRISTMPKVSPDQQNQFNWYRFEKCHKKIVDPELGALLGVIVELEYSP